MNLEKIRLYADAHAIEAAIFAVNLLVPIDNADIRRFNEKSDELKKHFPFIQGAEVVHIDLGNMPPNQVPPPPPPPQQLIYYANDGRPEWTGFFGENKIVVSCLRYTRWEEVWPSADARIKALLACLDSYKPLHSIDYSVTDTYTAEKADEVLVAPNLFCNSAYVPGKILEMNDPRWDFSQGWFDNSNIRAYGETLVRVEGKSVIQNNGVVASINNLHSQRLGAPTSVDDILSANGASSRLEQIFDDLHERNKDLLRNLLDDNLLSRMKLKEISNV